MKRLLRWLGVVGPLVLAAGCRPTNPACSPEALGSIEAGYVAAMVTRCRGFSFEACPERGDIEEEYATRREAWRVCR